MTALSYSDLLQGLIMMDSFSTSLSTKKTQCASTHHSRKYTHRHKHNLYTHIMVHLDLWKCLLKKESFELGFEEGWKFSKLAGSEFQTVDLFI